ncbi:MAG: response regulator [Symploca sp. SIO2G7]|nr:response regulator [Symploca sp. SIO2G7]
MKVWFVDDLLENRNTWLNSFPERVVLENQFESFASVSGLLERCSSGDSPDILFVDFFIDGSYGIDVIKFFQKSNRQSPLIIAHSSMDEANDAMLRAGANLKMAKVKGAAVTSSIARDIQDSEALRRLLEFREQPNR